MRYAGAVTADDLDALVARAQGGEVRAFEVLVRGQPGGRRRPGAGGAAARLQEPGLVPVAVGLLDLAVRRGAERLPRRGQGAGRDPPRAGAAARGQARPAGGWRAAGRAARGGAGAGAGLGGG